MNWIEMIGYVAAFCTTISFLPQAIKILKTKNTSGISVSMYSIFTFGVASWLVYGIASHAWPIIIANGTTFILAAFILYLKLKMK